METFNYIGYIFTGYFWKIIKAIRQNPRVKVLSYITHYPLYKSCLNRCNSSFYVKRFFSNRSKVTNVFWLLLKANLMPNLVKLWITVPAKTDAAKQSSRLRAVVVAQLVERSFLIPEVRGLNTVIGKKLFVSIEHLFTVNCLLERR